MPQSRGIDRSPNYIKRFDSTLLHLQLQRTVLSNMTHAGGVIFLGGGGGFTAHAHPLPAKLNKMCVICITQEGGCRCD